MTETLLTILPASCPVLVGRTGVLRVLDESLEAAAAGQGQVLVLSGEAGIGKSRLAAEARARAGGRGFRVLRAGCFEPDQLLPYAPLLDLLAAAGQLAGEPAGSAGPITPELAWLFARQAQAGSVTAAQAGPTSEWEKRRFLAAAAATLVNLTSPEDSRPAAPLLAVIEDLHWSDPSTLEFLLFLARRVPEHAFLLLLTQRSDEASPHLTHFLASLERERLAREILLAHLDRAEVAAMLAAFIALPSAAQSEFADLIYGLTDGNPFFVEELLKSMILSGDVFHTHAGWERKPLSELSAIPRSVQDAIQRRLDRCSSEGRHIVLLAAVIGRRCDFTLLQQLAGMAEQPLLDGLKELIAVQLLVEQSAEEFAFRHALAREALYAQLMRRERKALHGEVAAAMQRTYGGRREYCGALARHFFAAEQWAEALAYSQAAAEWAASVYSLPEAIAHYTCALDAAAQLSQAPPSRPGAPAVGAVRESSAVGSQRPPYGSQQPGSGPPPTLHLLAARGRIYEMLGDFERAQADYEAALAQASAAGDPASQWQVLLDLGFLWTARDYAHAGRYLDQALALARHLEDDATLAHTLNRVGNWYFNLGQVLRARRHHEEALAIFASLADEPGLAETWDLLGLTALNQGDLESMAACYTGAIALYRKLGDRRGLSSALANFAQRGAVHGDPLRVASPARTEEPLHDAEEALRLAREIGWQAGEAYALAALGSLRLRQAEYAAALALFEASLEGAERIGHRQWLIVANGGLAGLYADFLDFERADAYSARALEHAQATHSLNMIRTATSWRAYAYLKQGDPLRAEQLLSSAADTPVGTDSFTERLWWYVRAELALAQGEPAQALQIAGRIVAATPNLSPGAVVPLLWKLRGEALAAMKRYADAEADLLAACVALRDAHYPALLWQMRIALGKVYRLQRRRDRTEAEFAAARTLIDWLAARMPSTFEGAFRARAMAQVPALAPPSARRLAKQAFGGLTAREREVAGMIAAGKSNREIAALLVVSERTVETHVANILAKLGLQARTQIAAWAAGKDLVGGQNAS